MKHLPLGEGKGRGGWRAVTVSVGLHLLLGLGLLALKLPEAARGRGWVEMVVSEPEPLPPPEPSPLPEPEPPPERARAEIAQVAPIPSPPSQAPTPERPVRRIQGLSSSSFLQNSGTALAVRAGSALDVGATDETMGLDEAVPWSAISSMPRCRKPDLTAPDEVRAQGIEGTVEIALDLDERGAILEARVVRSLSPEADRACLQAWRATRCTAAKAGDRPVAVRSVPYRCTYQAMQ